MWKRHEKDDTEKKEEWKLASGEHRGGMGKEYPEEEPRKTRTHEKPERAGISEPRKARRDAKISRDSHIRLDAELVRISFEQEGREERENESEASSPRRGGGAQA